MNNQVMTRDDHSEQQNLKINVNVILNVFFCLFYKMRTNSVHELMNLLVFLLRSMNKLN